MLWEVLIDQAEELLADIGGDGGIEWRIEIDDIAFACVFVIGNWFLVL